MLNSSLVQYTAISPNSAARTHKIDTITIHHAAMVRASAADIGRVFANTSAQASSNYGIGYDGEIGLYVPEDRRAFTSSNRTNDNRAITIEVANSKGEPNWEVSEASYRSLIRLCADICKRNGIEKLLWKNDPSLIGQVKKQNMTIHRWFAATACPGEYLYSKMGDIANDVNKILEGEIEEMDIGKFIDELTPQQAYQIWNKANQYLMNLGPDPYAVDACKKGVTFKIFSDGDGDRSIDIPKTYVERQQLAVLLDRLGLLK